jgi:adenylyltransferase/sulfurtransferase
MKGTNEVPEITPAELKARLDAGDVPLLVDVREHSEREIADLPDLGQERVPTAELFLRMRELEADRDIVVYCRSGSRSQWAARVLLESGRDRVFNLRGGLLAWREEVDPSLTAY